MFISFLKRGGKTTLRVYLYEHKESCRLYTPSFQYRPSQAVSLDGEWAPCIFLFTQLCIAMAFVNYDKRILLLFIYINLFVIF